MRVVDRVCEWLNQFPDAVSLGAEIRERRITGEQRCHYLCIVANLIRDVFEDEIISVYVFPSFFKNAGQICINGESSAIPKSANDLALAFDMAGASCLVPPASDDDDDSDGEDTDEWEMEEHEHGEPVGAV